jgi:clan AA aspartic protease
VGITFTQARLANPRRADLGEIEVELLVDTGALYSVLPASLLERLAVERLDRRDFTLADGSHVAYDVGEVTFVVDGHARTSLVVFAPEGVQALLGVLALESLGLMVNPVTRELLPMRLFLAGAA